MGKVTLAVLLAAIALGVYWFWWSDQGANSPITIEGTISVAGIPLMPGMQGPMEADFTLQATPSKRKFTLKHEDKRVTDILCPGKKEWYVLDEKKEVYAQLEFNLVEMTETASPLEMKGTWFGGLKRTADWDYIGTGDGKRFCNKQTFTGLPEELKEMVKSADAPPAALAQVEALSKNIQWELWFTPDTRVGKRYFSMFNKLIRIDPVGRGEMNTLLDIAKLFKGKRPQIKYVNLDYFPFPMKAVVSFGPMRVEMNVKNISRKKIPKDAFEVPSNYKKVSLKEVM